MFQLITVCCKLHNMCVDRFVLEHPNTAVQPPPLAYTPDIRVGDSLSRNVSLTPASIKHNLIGARFCLEILCLTVSLVARGKICSLPSERKAMTLAMKVGKISRPPHAMESASILGLWIWTCRSRRQRGCDFEPVCIKYIDFFLFAPLLLLLGLRPGAPAVRPAIT